MVSTLLLYSICTITGSRLNLIQPMLGTSRRAPNEEWYMPEESAPHKRTWMVFGASEKIWGRKLLPEVRRNLALIAKTIVKYEPVTMLVRAEEKELARKLVGPKVQLIVAKMDDLWVRDTGPTFVLNEVGQKAAIDFNFNGWGQQQDFAKDAKIASFIAKQSGVKLNSTNLILEGGALEVDGNGTAIISESCVVNPNRNPNKSRKSIEIELQLLLGCTKIIWIPGIKGKDITDGHTDFYARFVGGPNVLAGLEADKKSFDYNVTRKNILVLQAAKNAHSEQIVVTPLNSPEVVRSKFASDDFAAGYIGFYVCNGAVIMQGFGDPKADLAARQIIQKAYPGRKIEQLNIDGIAAGGGSIHCATQQEPKAFNQ